MSGFLSGKRFDLDAYVPGEQPRDRRYIKLNTNESPFPPSPLAVRAASEAAERLMLYPDPEYRSLREALSSAYGVPPECVAVGNGSDEILNFCFAAFCDEKRRAVFPDVTYGFYPVFAKQNRVPFETVPLRYDLTVSPDMLGRDGCSVFIANPNAPTGIFLPVETIRRAAEDHPDTLYVIDEAYIDFGGESCVPLTKRLKNVIVTGTFSKSRSMAGARLGFGIACPELIGDINLIRNSLNPYNVGMMTAAAGEGALADPGYTAGNCARIVAGREKLTRAMRRLGFEVTDSLANFVFARHDLIGGAELYSVLRENGILVRHFDGERTGDYVRITIGSENEIETLIGVIGKIIGSKTAEKEHEKI